MRSWGRRAVLPSSWIIVPFWIVAIVSTVVAFAIWLISRVILALYIAIGPLLIGLALFPATRSILERWIGLLVSCVILQITTIVLLYIVLAVEQQVTGQIALTAETDLIGRVEVLLAGVIFFGLAGFVAFQLPGVASSLSGSRFCRKPIASIDDAQAPRIRGSSRSFSGRWAPSGQFEAAHQSCSHPSVRLSTSPRRATLRRP